MISTLFFLATFVFIPLLSAGAGIALSHFLEWPPITTHLLVAGATCVLMHTSLKIKAAFEATFAAKKAYKAIQPWIAEWLRRVK